MGVKLYGAWDVFIVIVTTYTTVAIPLSVAIYESGQIYYDRELFLTVVYVSDVLISFLRIKRKASFIHLEYNAMKVYYRRWIVADIIAALPLAALFGVPWLQLFRLTKIAKVVYLIQIFRRIKAHFTNTILLMQFLYWAAIATHWLSCGWIRIHGLDHDVDVETNYIDALYWTVSTMTTVGYGDITPVTSLERLYAIITMIFGYSFLGYLIGSFASILTKKDPIKEKYTQNMEKLTNAARYANLPLDLQRRIYDYFNYQMTRRVGYDEESFINELPPGMRGEVSLYFRKEVIENIYLFTDAPQSFIMEIAQQLRERIVAPDDYVFKAGDQGQQMFLIAHGSVSVFSEDETQLYRTLSEGDFFGEIALFQDSPRTATVKANTYCDIYSLGKLTFEKTLEQYPEIAAKIKEKATQRSRNEPN